MFKICNFTSKFAFLQKSAFFKFLFYKKRNCDLVQKPQCYKGCNFYENWDVIAKIQFFMKKREFIFYIFNFVSF